MGTKGADMAARPPASNVVMADLEAWFKEVKTNHDAELRIVMSMSGKDDLAFWRFTVFAYLPDGNGGEREFSRKSLVWPTASHKTVLGSLLWLIITLDDDLTASAVLASASSAGL